MTEDHPTFVHYHSHPVVLDRNYNYSAHHQRTDKPTGLWFSENTDDGWAQWCMAEEYDLDGLRVPHTLEFTDDARILHIATPEALEAFNAEYADDRIPTLRRTNFAIRWDIIAENYDAIRISPHQWRHHNNFEMLWYNGWDCASGCVWNLHAIASLTPILIP